MREDARVEARIQALGPTDKVVTCPIVRGEVLYESSACQKASDAPSWARKRNLFGRIPCEPIPEGAGDAYAKIKRAREHKGFSLDENDIWIAATASAIGATLVTRDRDFASISGLTIVDWTSA